MASCPSATESLAGMRPLLGTVCNRVPLNGTDAQMCDAFAVLSGRAHEPYAMSRVVAQMYADRSRSQL